MRRLAVLALSLLGCGSPEPAPAPAPSEPAAAPASPPLAPQPTAEERAQAEALAARFVAAFDQVEEAFGRGELEIAPLEAVRGPDAGPVWSASGTDLIETPRRPGQPESVAWCAALGMLGDRLPDVSFTLERHRLEVGVYRADAEGTFVRPAGIVLLRLLKDVPGRSITDGVVEADGTRRVTATQQVHELATAGVLVSRARLEELLRGR